MIVFASFRRFLPVLQHRHGKIGLFFRDDEEIRTGRQQKIIFILRLVPHPVRGCDKRGYNSAAKGRQSGSATEIGVYSIPILVMVAVALRVPLSLD